MFNTRGVYTNNCPSFNEKFYQMFCEGCLVPSPICSKARVSDLEWPWSLIRLTLDDKPEIQKKQTTIWESKTAIARAARAPQSSRLEKGSGQILCMFLDIPWNLDP